MKKPLVSIYIPTHNRPDLFERALKSVSRQTYKNIEVLVGNDGSKDVFEKDYQDILGRYEGEVNKLTYVRNSSPLGASKTRNILIKMAKGDYITGLDDDDFFAKERVENFLNSRCLERYSFLCSHNKTIKKYNFPRRFRIITFEDMKKYNAVGNQIFCRTSVFEVLGGFDEQMPGWEDYDLWFRAVKKFGPAARLSFHDYLYDADENRERISNSVKAYDGYKYFINKHKADLSVSDLVSIEYQSNIERREKIDFSSKKTLSSGRAMLAYLKSKIRGSY